MSACIQCGSQLAEQATFCPVCGRPVAATDPSAQPGAPAGYQPTQPATDQPAQPAADQPAGYPATQPAVSPAGPTWPGSPQPGPYLVAGPSAPPRYPGDWAGAIIAVTSGVLVMLAASLVAVLIIVSAIPAGVSGPGPSQLTGLTAIYTALSMGGSVQQSADAGFGTETLTLSYQFLGPAVLGFALIGLIYVRRLRRNGTPTPRGAVAQVARCAVVMAVELVVVFLLTLVGTSTASTSEHAEIGTTLLFGLVTLAVTLLIAGFVGLSGLPARAERVRMAIAGPLRGVLFMLVLANVATLVAVLIRAAYVLNENPPADTSAGDAWRGIAFLLVLGLPNIAVGDLILGMGVPVSGDFAGSLASLGGSGGQTSIFDLVKQNQVYWAWPLIVALLVLVAGLVAGRRSPYTVNGRSMALMLVVVLPAVLLCLALMSSGSGSGAVPDDVNSHLNFGLTLLAGAAWGLLGGLVGMAVAARRRPAAPPLYTPPMAPAQAFAPAAERYPAGYVPPGYAAPGYPPATAPPTLTEPPQQPRPGYPPS